VLIARDRAEKAFPKVGAQYARKPGDPPLVWVSEAVSDLYGFSPGQKIQCPSTAKASHWWLRECSAITPASTARFSSTAPITPRSRATGA